VGPGGDDVAHLFAQAGEVGGQQAGGDSGDGCGGHERKLDPLFNYDKGRFSAIIAVWRGIGWRLPAQRLLSEPYMKPYDISVSVTPQYLPEQSEPNQEQ